MPLNNGQAAEHSFLAIDRNSDYHIARIAKTSKPDYLSRLAS